MKEGHIKTARVLLTESRSAIWVEISFSLSNILRVSAEAANTKGRSPLHEFARFIVCQSELTNLSVRRSKELILV